MRNILHRRPGRLRSPVFVRPAASPAADDAGKFVIRVRQYGRRVAIALMVTALLLGAGGCRKSTTGSSVPVNRQATLALVPQSFFSPVPNAELVHARNDSECSVDRINHQTAAGMAVDHLGASIFTGWVGDRITYTVPTAIRLVLAGADSYWATGETGYPRPDVAAFKHVPAYAKSGFRVHASMYAVPVGDYTMEIVHQVDGKWVRCVTGTRVSVQ